MQHHFEDEADALVMEQNDHVATALKDLASGDTVRFRMGESIKTVIAADAIPFGHKIAIGPIASGTEVRKYGEVIGRALTGIETGGHVHVHNMEGIRGRGDKAKQEQAVSNQSKEAANE
ncbi:UxaA family hydrolase [Paenibacillus gansuensis]|uniref:UxaA family hydrolase n=1 Tax=Paenibacillus gansuensis TaxID=306542 RepID=A0ABW5PCV8_9BACL